VRTVIVGGTVVVLVVLGFLAAPALSTHEDNPVLDAIVGTNDGFDIGLFFPNGTRVGSLPPGTYTIVVHDRSKLHNFHLASNFDPTVDFRTDVDFVGDQTFTATFRPNTEYAYACEPHWQIMNGGFRTTGGPGTTSEPTTTTKPPPARVTLRADVSAAGRVSFRPLAVRAGPVRVVVRDRSRRFNVHLRGVGVNRRTPAAFVGSKTWTLTLRRGAYRFGSDPKPLRGILRAR
jgi:hypothetical protein